jgi:hypothetical protein
MAFAVAYWKKLAFLSALGRIGACLLSMKNSGFSGTEEMDNIVLARMR